MGRVLLSEPQLTAFSLLRFGGQSGLALRLVAFAALIFSYSQAVGSDQEGAPRQTTEPGSYDPSGGGPAIHRGVGRRAAPPDLGDHPVLGASRDSIRPVLPQALSHTFKNDRSVLDGACDARPWCISGAATSTPHILLVPFSTC